MTPKWCFSNSTPFLILVFFKFYAILDFWWFWGQKGSKWPKTVFWGFYSMVYVYFTRIYAVYDILGKYGILVFWGFCQKGAKWPQNGVFQILRHSWFWCFSNSTPFLIFDDFGVKKGQNDPKRYFGGFTQWCMYILPVYMPYMTYLVNMVFWGFCQKGAKWPPKWGFWWFLDAPKTMFIYMVVRVKLSFGVFHVFYVFSFLPRHRYFLNNCNDYLIEKRYFGSCQKGVFCSFFSKKRKTQYPWNRVLEVTI